MYQDAYHLRSSLQARVANRVTDREVIYDLSLFRTQVQVAVHFVIKECSNACRAKSKSLRSKIQPLTDGTRLEVDVTITTIAEATGGALKIADHGECHASISCQVLP